LHTALIFYSGLVSAAAILLREAEMERLFDMVKKFADASKPPRPAVCLYAVRYNKILAVLAA
jgi:hypothetical protein